jgi:hypothetical protein
VYIFHAGYWGTQVGFYGGVNYGFGYGVPRQNSDLLLNHDD